MSLFTYATRHPSTLFKPISTNVPSFALCPRAPQPPALRKLPQDGKGIGLSQFQLQQVSFSHRARSALPLRRKFDLLWVAL